MVLLEFLWRIGEHDQNRVDPAGNGRQENAADEQTGDESYAKGGGQAVHRQFQYLAVEGSQRNTDATDDESDHHADQENGATHQVVGNDGLPSAVLEQLHDRFPCLDVTVSVHAYVQV